MSGISYVQTKCERSYHHQTVCLHNVNIKFCKKIKRKTKLRRKCKHLHYEEAPGIF